MNGIQEAFNNAFAKTMGYHDADALLAAIPKDKRLKGTPDRQTAINHAMALMQGFDTVEDLVAANGMNGSQGLKSRQF